MSETGLALLPVAIQSQLGLRDPRWRPLSDVKTVLRDLGELEMDAAQVRELVETGLLIGFNIAVHLNSKPELRVLTKSIEFFRQGARAARARHHELEWPQIFRLICPHQKPIVTGLEIRRALICDRGHVENLIIATELTAVKKSQPGPGGSWVITRASYEAFMKGRLQ